MPIYEYQCQGCEHEFEEMQRITSEPHATCPTCGSEDCKRLLSLSSFRLKGSGWYMTDYANKTVSPHNGSEKNGKHAEGGKDDVAKVVKDAEAKVASDAKGSKVSKDSKSTA